LLQRSFTAPSENRARAVSAGPGPTFAQFFRAARLRGPRRRASCFTAPYFGLRSTAPSRHKPGDCASPTSFEKVYLVRGVGRVSKA